MGLIHLAQCRRPSSGTLSLRRTHRRAEHERVKTNATSSISRETPVLSPKDFWRARQPEAAEIQDRSRRSQVGRSCQSCRAPDSLSIHPARENGERNTAFERRMHQIIPGGPLELFRRHLRATAPQPQSGYGLNPCFFQRKAAGMGHGEVGFVNSSPQRQQSSGLKEPLEHYTPSFRETYGGLQCCAFGDDHTGSPCLARGGEAGGHAPSSWGAASLTFIALSGSF